MAGKTVPAFRQEKNMRKLVVTGSSGFIGSEVVDYFCKLGWEAHGMDKNMPADFFGPASGSRWNQHRLKVAHQNISHHKSDIRDRRSMDALLETLRLGVIVHAVAPAQP